MGGSLESRCVGRVYGADGADGAVRPTLIQKLGAENHMLQHNI